MCASFEPFWPWQLILKLGLKYLIFELYYMQYMYSMQYTCNILRIPYLYRACNRFQLILEKTTYLFHSKIKGENKK
jgi:hypothetical protein